MTGELRPKDVAVRLFADPMPPMPMEEGTQHAYTMRNKSGDVVSHHYTTSLTPVSENSPMHFRVVEVRTPGGGYSKGLFPALSPKEKVEAESGASTPKREKRHLTPPAITCPRGQYESEDEKVLKGPNVIQLLRTIVGLKKDNQKLTD